MTPVRKVTSLTKGSTGNDILNPPGKSLGQILLIHETMKRGAIPPMADTFFIHETMKRGAIPPIQLQNHKSTPSAAKSTGSLRG